MALILWAYVFFLSPLERQKRGWTSSDVMLRLDILFWISDVLCSEFILVNSYFVPREVKEARIGEVHMEIVF